MSMRLELRQTRPLALVAGLPVLALVLAAVFCAGLVMLAGANPVAVIVLIWKGAAGSQSAVLEILTRATPLIFTGLAAATAFQAKLWNFGGEGQFYAGAVATAFFGTGLLPLPPWLLIPVLIVAAALAGAIVLAVPTFLKTRFGADEAVTTLLFNFIMLLFASLLLDGVLKDPAGMGLAHSGKILLDATLFKFVPGERLHGGFILAVVCAVVLWIGERKTTLGFEMRAVGQNSKAATFAGIPVSQVLAKTALISGGLAALGGFSEVAGLRGNLTLELSSGFGYTGFGYMGIVVAMLAMLHPVGVVISAIFVAGVLVGADAMGRTMGVPSSIAPVMVAMLLLTMVTAMMFTQYRLRWR
jgi:general nucleoside transport system permease protein